MWWKKTPFLVACVLFAVFVLVQLRPGSYRVTREVDIAAAPEAVFRRLEDLRQWRRWSPWSELDPQVKLKYDGPARGVGASYSWDGSGAVGQGKITVVEADEPVRVTYRVEFIAPWNATVQNTFVLTKLNAGTHVTWAIAGKRHFWSKLFGFFSDPNEVLGVDMERGLDALKKLIEKPTSRASVPGRELRVAWR